jgi:hypothetical protein
MEGYFFDSPLPESPGGPVWSWFRSPLPHPGLAEGLVASARCGTVGETTGGGEGGGGESGVGGEGGEGGAGGGGVAGGATV